MRTNLSVRTLDLTRTIIPCQIPKNVSIHTGDEGRKETKSERCKEGKGGGAQKAKLGNREDENEI
jgi:hypothetical protein